MKEQDIKDYFMTIVSGNIKRVDIMSIYAIEGATGIPHGSLQSFLSGKQYCHINKHLDKLIKFLIPFGLQILE